MELKREVPTNRQVIAKYGDNSNFEAIDSQDRFASSIETSTPIVYTHTYYYEAESGRSYNKTFYYDKGKRWLHVFYGGKYIRLISCVELL